MRVSRRVLDNKLKIEVILQSHAMRPYRSAFIHDKHRGVPSFGKDERDFLLNNCQNFVTEVEKEYYKIVGKEKL